MDYDATDIPEDHASQLCTLAGVTLVEQIPDKLVKGYWELKRVFDRINQRVGSDHLALTAIKCGFGAETAKEKIPPNVAELFRAGRIEREAPVYALWRGKRHKGVLKHVDAQGRVIALLEGDDDERTFEAKDVTPAKDSAVAV